MDKEEWLLMEYRNEPQASEEVLQFIADFLFHKNSNGKEDIEMVKHLFKTYCWYFAHMLQLAFGRGRVYYVHDEHYFVWRDDNFDGIMLYDIDGVYHTHKILIPEDELSIEERKMLHDEAMPYANNNTTMMEKLLKRISNPQMSAISKRKGC